MRSCLEISAMTFELQIAALEKNGFGREDATKQPFHKKSIAGLQHFENALGPTDSCRCRWKRHGVKVYGASRRV